jgi:hypothetical protein
MKIVRREGCVAQPSLLLNQNRDLGVPFFASDVLSYTLC